MDRLVAYSKEPMGPEWFTVTEYSNRYGVSVARAHAKLRALHKQELLDKWTGIGGPNKRLLHKYRVKA